jgi:hypothetical protein
MFVIALMRSSAASKYSEMSPPAVLNRGLITNLRGDVAHGERNKTAPTEEPRLAVHEAHDSTVTAVSGTPCSHFISGLLGE